MNNEKTYIAIDLKSFYASVECMERGLDPMKTNLVVADKSRTDKTKKIRKKQKKRLTNEEKCGILKNCKGVVGALRDACQQTERSWQRFTTRLI